MCKWEQLVKPDMAQLGCLIMKAKGEERTMAELAELVGTSASTLSRAVTGKATRPVSYEIIEKIAEHAAEGSGVLLEDLLYANGYRRKRERIVWGENDIFDKIERRDKLSDVVKSKVLESGAQVAIAKRYTPESDLEQFFLDIGFASHEELILQTNLFPDTNFWVVNPCSYISVQEDGSDATDRVSLILQQVSAILMCDNWRPDILKGVRYTFSIADEVMYREFLRAVRLMKARFNNCFTVMWVDIEAKEIVEETVLENSSGLSTKITDLI